MNKTGAKKISETITYDQLVKMFDNAKSKITDWTVVSNVNKQMSKGAAWNILYKGLSRESFAHQAVIKNMIWEFGDYLDESLKVNKPTKIKKEVKITHQEPIF